MTRIDVRGEARDRVARIELASLCGSSWLAAVWITRLGFDRVDQLARHVRELIERRADGLGQVARIERV